MRRTWFLPYWALYALLLTSCAPSPMAPEPVVEPVVEEPLAEPTPEPLTPAEGRALLQEAGVPYSQASFLSAAHDGDLRVVEAFVAVGMDVDVQNEDQHYDTALMRASQQGHVDVVVLLLRSGADPNLRNGLCAGHIAFPDLVIDAQGDGQCSRQTALKWASHAGHLDVVRALVEGGALAHFHDEHWVYEQEGPDRPLTLAAAGGHLDVVRYLVPHVTVRLTGSTYGDLVRGGYQALMWASYGGHQAVAAYLLGEGSGTGGGKFGINPRKPLGAARGEGFAPLHFAAIAGQTEMVGWLLERGADIHVRVTRWIVVWEGGEYSTFKSFGASALTLAASEGHIETLRLLLDHWVWSYGSDGRDDHGRTTLMYAAAAGDTDTMRDLIAEGAPINARTHTDATALMFAAHEGHADAVALLLEMGADTTIANNNNDTALILAQEQGHDAIVAMLRG